MCVPNNTFCPITDVEIYNNFSTYKSNPNDNILLLNYPNSSNNTTTNQMGTSIANITETSITNSTETNTTTNTSTETGTTIVNSTGTSTGIPTNVSSIANSSSLLVFKRNPGQPYLYKFAISFYDRPCLNPYAYPVSKILGGYPLMKINEEGCLYYGNLDTSLTIDELAISYVFDDNNLTNNISNLPWYSNYTNGQNAYLIGLLQFSINKNLFPCQDMNVQNLYALNAYEKDFDYMITSLGMTEIALALLLSIFYAIEISFRKKFDDDDNRVIGITVVAQIIYLASCIVYIAFGVYIYSRDIENFQPKANYFETISTLNCFDDNTVNIAFRDFYRKMGTNFNGVVYFSKILMILSGISLGLWIIAIIARLILEIIKRRGGLESVSIEESEDDKTLKKNNNGIELLFAEKNNNY